MNKDRVISLCHKISKETGLAFNAALIHYFLESILIKLARSPYGEHFIFKGGFLLSNVVGIESRSTVDIDFLIKNTIFSEERLMIMLQESLKHDDSDTIRYEFQRLIPIKEKSHYGGFRANVLCKLENIRQVVPLDIATGDIITPHPIEYKYSSNFGNDDILIQAYPIETMLAEKIQTIVEKGFLNSRSKDFYDIHVLYQLKNDSIDRENLVRACARTFEYRNTEFELSEVRSMLVRLQNDEAFLNRWNAYANKNSYVQGVSFDSVINSALALIDEL